MQSVYTKEITVSKTPKLYDTGRKTPVSTRPTKQFLQDLNLLMASYRLDGAEVVRQSVHAQAEAVRQKMSEAFSLAPQKEKS